jgi:hypothetical protein
MGKTSSGKLTKERQIARNRLKRRDGRVVNRLLFDTPLTRVVTRKIFVEQMSDFMAGKFDDKPPECPGDLGDVIKQLDPETLALTILVPFLDAIGRGWKEGASEEMRAALQIGRYLHSQVILHKLDLTDSVAAKDVRLGRKPAWKFLKPEWGDEEIVRAGEWMIMCAGMIGYFDYDERGFPAIRPQWQAVIDQIAEEMLHNAPVHLPHLSPPPDWTGWHNNYADGTHATFVCGGQRETQAAIEAAFAAEHSSAFADAFAIATRRVRFDELVIDLGDEPARFEHADGVNALQRVPLKINLPVLALVEEFAVTVKEHKAGRANWPDRDRAPWLKADKATVAYGSATRQIPRRSTVLAVLQLRFPRPAKPPSASQLQPRRPRACTVPFCPGREAQPVPRGGCRRLQRYRDAGDTHRQLLGPQRLVG